MEPMEKLDRCLAAVRKKTDFVPEVALVLGSGLGDYGNVVDVETVIPYSEIEGLSRLDRAEPRGALSARHRGGRESGRDAGPRALL